MVFTTLKTLGEAHEDGVWALTWSKKGKLLSGSLDGMCKVWSGESFAPIQNLEGHTLGVISVDFHPNGFLAASSSLDGTIRIWDATSGTTVKTIEPGPAEVWTVAISPDGRVVATGSHNGNASLYSVESGELDRTFESKHKFVFKVAFVKYTFSFNLFYADLPSCPKVALLTP